MKSGESDELRRAEVEAQHATARAVGRAAHALEAPAREQHERELASLRHPPRRVFHGEGGTVLLLRSIPGFADLWRREVPASHITPAVARDGKVWHLVGCMCGEHAPLRPGQVVDCPGECGRWFLHTGRTICVKRFEDEAAA